MAPGAGAGDIVRLVLDQGLRLVAPGIVLGFAAALLATRALAGMLHGVPLVGPLSLATVGLRLTGVALVASYLPARRALRMDPSVTPRAD